MEEINKAILLAIDKFRNEVKDGRKLDEGDSFVTIFNNCCLYISFEDGELRSEFLGDLPLKIDMSLSIYEQEDKPCI